MKLSKGDINELLQARSEIDEELRRHKTNLTVLFTDVVGSTGYFERFGDTAGVLLMHRHDNFVMNAVREFDGTVVKTIGDSVMAEFPGPLQAVLAAMEIQDQLREHNAHVVEQERLQVRIGINSGQGFRRGADVYGDAVNVAARITKFSGAAQIVVSNSVKQGLGNSDIQCRSLGPVSLEGKSEPEELFEVVWSDASIPSTLELPSAPLLSNGAESGAPTLERYKIISRVGAGGTGIVFQALDRETGEIVALKVLHPAIAAQPDRLEIFRNEMRLARRITHKNVCRLYDFNRVDDVTFISMEYVRGESLRRVIERFGALGTRKAIGIATQICEGLQEVHAQGLVHRDLKPENLMIDEAGNVKIMDFGVAHPAGDETANRAIGTPCYMSPEQIQGGAIDPRADIYSLGLVLFEIFTGTRAFERETPIVAALRRIQDQPPDPRKVDRAIPGHVSKVILRCLEIDPQRRFQTVEEVRNALLSTNAEPKTVVEQLRGKLWVVTAGVMIATLSVLTAVALARVSVPEPGRDDTASFVEAAAFRLAQSLDTTDAWNTFLRTYGDGKLAATARSRVEQLRSEAAATLVVTVGPEPLPATDSPPKWIAALDTVAVPPGVFAMGSDNGKGDEKPSHQVRLDGFYLSRGEITNRQYLQFLVDSGHERPRDPAFAKNYLIAYPDLPVVNVSYDDAVAFCKWASAKYGATVQLPTEAQWEYAARAGRDADAVPWGIEDPAGYTRFKGNAPRDVKTVKRGAYKANRFGLYNMQGNVAEWVQDYYSRDYYTISPLKNPRGPKSGQSRVVRGGSWADDADQLMYTRRASRSPGDRSDQVGFRVVVLAD